MENTLNVIKFLKSRCWIEYNTKLMMHLKLKTGGVLHMATDWQHYAEHMLEVLSENTHFKNLSATADYIPRPESRPLTKFEQRGLRLGHGVWDLQFEACPK